MKLAIWFALPVAILAVSPPRRGNFETLYQASRSLNPRQFDYSSVAPVAKNERLEPKLRKDAVRERISYGPFQVPGANETAPKGFMNPFTMDPDSVVFSFTTLSPCSKCTILSAKSDLAFLNGTRADIAYGLYQHHIAIMDRAQPKLPFWLCAGQYLMGMIPARGFVINGNDEAPSLFTTPDGQFKSGYLIDNTSFMVQAEVVNYNPTNRTIYVTLELEYLDGMQKGYQDASFTVFSATGCGAASYHAPAGQAQYNLTSEKTPMPVDGHIVNARGHLHDGGDRLLLNLNGRQVCDSTATYGGANGQLALNGKEWKTITEMSQCTEPIPFKKGDELSMTSVYDTDLHPLRESIHGHEQDEMGMFFMSVALNKTG